MSRVLLLFVLVLVSAEFSSLDAQIFRGRLYRNQSNANCGQNCQAVPQSTYSAVSNEPFQTFTSQSLPSQSLPSQPPQPIQNWAHQPFATPSFAVTPSSIHQNHQVIQNGNMPVEYQAPINGAGGGLVPMNYSPVVHESALFQPNAFSQQAGQSVVGGPATVEMTYSSQVVVPPAQTGTHSSHVNGVVPTNQSYSFNSLEQTQTGNSTVTGPVETIVEEPLQDDSIAPGGNSLPIVPLAPAADSESRSVLQGENDTATEEAPSFDGPALGTGGNN